MASDDARWPELPLEPWLDTMQTLHLWSQIVGKIRLGQMPWINHSWHVPLYVTARGLTTSLMPHRAGAFQIDFDFIDHFLHVTSARGPRFSLVLRPMSVAAFYDQLMGALRDMGLEVSILARPVELPDPITPFAKDKEHAAYDSGAVSRFWQALVPINAVLTEFRARFMGKVSPVHFFWGAFDLAVTRFSGRTAPKHPGGMPNVADWVMVEAYSHEVSSAGFWPGAGLGEAAFYSYAYPEPAGYSERRVLPEAAYYNQDIHEFILPYEAVRTADDPEATLMSFLQSTYEAAADLAGWDREALEWSGEPRRGEAGHTGSHL